LPLLLISGAIGEEQAVEAMKAGFHDFIIKGRYSQLTQALERELREVVVRRERGEAIASLRRANAELEQRVAERTAEFQAANTKLRASRVAALNLMEDAVFARKEAETRSAELRLEIAERKRAEEASRLSEERYRTLFNTLLEGFCIIEVLFDADQHPIDYRFLETNPAFETQTGLHNVQGKLISEVAPENEAYWFEIYGKVALTGEAVRFVNEAKALRRWYDVGAYRVGGPDSRKVAILFNDISERKRAEEQIEAINDNLEREVEQRTRELQETQKQFLHAEKLSAIGKLSASIAHEFNNPLQGIMSIIQGVKKRAVMDEEDRELLEAALEESDRMKDLIRSLQDFNRPSSHKKIFLDVHHSLESILLLHKSDFNKKRIAVERNYGKGLPQIQAVPDQIKQVILNLLTNAADACQAPGGKITVSTWQEGDRIAMAIKDTGVGIQPADMEHIFRPFYSTKAEVKGTGLGLSVSYGIVKNHQGEIRVDSRPGEGATFTVLLPIHGSDEVTAATD